MYSHQQVCDVDVVVGYSSVGDCSVVILVAVIRGVQKSFMYLLQLCYTAFLNTQQARADPEMNTPL